MAKHGIQEKYNITACGILNLEEMTLEMEELGNRSLKDFLRKLDGEEIKISISKIDSVE